jgi:YfiH family protein
MSDIVILDLEWNAAFSKKANGYINEIIEFGAVKCGPDLVKKSTFSSFVKQSIGKKINNVVSSLTNISQNCLDSAMPYPKVAAQFGKWAGDSLIVTWGNSDILSLSENYRYHTSGERVPFLHCYLDLQKYCQGLLGKGSKPVMGLYETANLLGIKSDEKMQHRALSDALITLEVMKKTYNPEEIEKYTEDAGRNDFYKKLNYKTVYICDLKHPDVVSNKSKLEFHCNKCGEQAEMLTDWVLDHKKFFAEFKCPKCGHEFTGTMQIKRKYEGLIITKKMTDAPIIEKPRETGECNIGAMHLYIINGVGLLRFRDWEKYDEVIHCFSTRIGGVSKDIYANMNLGLRIGDDDRNVFENFRRICLASGIETESLVTGSQRHHTNIRRVGLENCGTGIYTEKDMDDIDGLCTNEPGVTLVIYAADCVPIYYYDTAHHAIGLAHAGWRGTVAGMASEMLKKMNEEFGSHPEDLKIAIGPSIGPECFEVDKPCADNFSKLNGAESFVKDDQNGKYHVDLWECNKVMLTMAGVPLRNITKGGVCTMCNSDLMFSHRATRGKRGANAAFLSLKG